MGVDLSAEEVFKIAERVEREARDFYRQAAAVLAANATAAQMLLELAEMEAEHELTFAAMKLHLCRGEGGGEVLDGRAVGADWPGVVEMFTAGLQVDLAKLFSGSGASEQILRKAIEFEKETIVFFVGLKEMLSDPADKRKIDEIIKEELGHIIRLTGQLACQIS